MDTELQKDQETTTKRESNKQEVFYSAGLYDNEKEQQSLLSCQQHRDRRAVVYLIYKIEILQINIVCSSMDTRIGIKDKKMR